MGISDVGQYSTVKKRPTGGILTNTRRWGYYNIKNESGEPRTRDGRGLLWAEIINECGPAEC